MEDGKIASSTTEVVVEQKRGPSRSFQDVDVWKRAHAWVLAVHRLAERFPADQRYRLTSQLIDAASSVPTNFAEGFRRRSRREKRHFYNIAESSLDEARSWLLLAHDLKYGDATSALSEADQIARMLVAYGRSMSRRCRHIRRGSSTEHRFPAPPQRRE